MPDQRKCLRSMRLCVAMLLTLATGTVFSQNRLEPTRETHTGPWYESGAPVVKSLWMPGLGPRLQLRGRVLSTHGAPVIDALVELWHTDALGRYPPLRASLLTKRNGGFVIGTILPGHNQDYRARHIHFVVSHPGHEPLVTRIYFKGDENMDEAPYPELAVFLEEGRIGEIVVQFAEVEFVIRPR